MRLTQIKENESRVRFPMWVEPPSACATRTFSLVIPRTRFGDSKLTRHGAHKQVQTYPNRPTKSVPRRGLPGLYTMWADDKGFSDGER